MSEKTVGVYAADVIPGVYTKTLTGIQRGIELYSRPDVKRPWRSNNKQKVCHEIALREKEIESLLQLCSHLRRKIGNVEHDRNVMEYTTEEMTKVNVKAKDDLINELTKEIEELNKKLHDTEEKVEHHIRLLKSEHENEVNKYKNEIRVANENYLASKKMFEQQIDDIKHTCSCEITLVESRIQSKVQELNIELASSRKNCQRIQELFESEKNNFEVTLKKIESDSNERAALAEQRINLLQQTHETELLEERKCNSKHLEEIRKLSMEVSLLKTEKHEYVSRNASWCQHLLDSLNSCFHALIKNLEELNVTQFSGETVTDILKSVTTSTNANTQEELNLYAPKLLLEEINNRIVMERLLCRISEIEVLSGHLIKEASHVEDNNNCGRGSDGMSSALHMELKNVIAKQERLNKILESVTRRQTIMEKCCKTFAQQAIFFSDNLYNKTSTNFNLLPPLPSQQPFYVGLRILNARNLWNETPELTRIMFSLFYTTLRCSLLSYGGYECYFTDTVIIMAFHKPTDAVMFCTKLVEWYIDCQLWNLGNTHVETFNLSSAFKQEDALKVMLKMCELCFTLTIHCGESYVESAACVHPCLSKYRTDKKENSLGLNAEQSICLLNKQNLHYYGPCLTELLDLMRTNTRKNLIILSSEAWHLYQIYKECNTNDILITHTFTVQDNIHSRNNEGQTKTSVTGYMMTTRAIKEKLQLLQKMHTNRCIVNGDTSNDEKKDKNLNVNNNDNTNKSFTRIEIIKDNAKENKINVFSEKSKVNNLNNVPMSLETLEENNIDENLENVEVTMLFTEVIQTTNSIQLLSEAIKALKVEANFISDEATTLLAKTREGKEHFHSLSPGEITAQMNDLFTVWNKVASRVEGVCAEINTLTEICKISTEKQNDLINSINKIMPTKFDSVKLESQTDELRVRYERMLDKIVEEHKKEVHRLNETLQERDNLLQRLAYVTMKEDVKPEANFYRKREESTTINNKEKLVSYVENSFNVESKK